MNWTAYQKPKSVPEALFLLEQSAGRGRVIAGGTDLVLQLRRRDHTADLLVDITGIDEIKRIGEDEEWILIGAAVPHAEVAGSPLILREARALAEGCGRVGSPQIRNVATLMGNVISAQPAADGAVPLMALEAEIRVASKAGERWIPMEEAYLGVGRSAIDASCEVATEIRFRKPGNDGQTKFFCVSAHRPGSGRGQTFPCQAGGVLPGIRGDFPETHSGSRPDRRGGGQSPDEPHTGKRALPPGDDPSSDDKAVAGDAGVAMYAGWGKIIK
jgi:hypothetical protein